MEDLLIILLPLLIQIESSGNDYAIGDNGASRGCLQIQEPYWIDGLQELSEDHDYETGSFDRALSLRVATGYLIRYGRLYTATTDKEPTLEVLARIHNGGPRGWDPAYPSKYANTTVYWNKVQGLLNKGE